MFLNSSLIHCHINFEKIILRKIFTVNNICPFIVMVNFADDFIFLKLSGSFNIEVYRNAGSNSGRARVEMKLSVSHISLEIFTL